MLLPFSNSPDAVQMSAFKEPLTGAGLTEKWLMREGKVQIRLNAVRTRLKGALPDAAAAKQAADIAALQQRISAVVQKQAFLEGMPGIPGAHACNQLRKISALSVVPQCSQHSTLWCLSTVWAALHRPLSPAEEGVNCSWGPGAISAILHRRI